MCLNVCFCVPCHVPVMGVSPIIIGPPLLMNRTVRFVEGGGDITVNVEGSPAAHPSPSFQWRLSNTPLQNDSKRMLEYATATINNVQRSDAGIYTLTASNIFVDRDEVFATGSGGFTLDVLCEWLVAP